MSVATSRAASVARKLHAVDRKDLAPDQALAVAYGEYAREDRGDVGDERAHEVGAPVASFWYRA